MHTPAPMESWLGTIAECRSQLLRRVLSWWSDSCVVSAKHWTWRALTFFIDLYNIGGTGTKYHLSKYSILISVPPVAENCIKYFFLNPSLVWRWRWFRWSRWSWWSFFWSFFCRKLCASKPTPLGRKLEIT